MIEITAKKDCSGCGACKEICGHNCISLRPDDEGFSYPSVDAVKCVNCGLCDKACPILNIPSDNDIRHVFAAKNKNEIERFYSSSGGIFRILAEAVLQEGGVVVGCRFNDKMEAVHAVATNSEELMPLMSSKYVQSDTTGIYTEVRQLLRDGRMVLFSGVPCQVAALKNFLIKPYGNLITIDILCHGVPSPKIFKEYREHMEDHYKGKTETLSFRWKEKSWKRLYINIEFSNHRRHHLFSGYDSYMQLFLSDRLQRPSCFDCPYNTLHRPGDLTLGDFWGIGKKHYDFDDNKGVSMVLINSDRGQELWDKISSETTYFETDIDTAVEGNKVLVQHLPSIAKRDEFYDYYVKHGFEAAIERFAPQPSKSYQHYRNFLRLGLDIVRKIKKEGY